MPHSCQLRPTFPRRKKTITGNRNSGESPVHRRKAPAPVKGVLAGAGERKILPPPTSPRSPEDGILSRAQLRPTFLHRRKTITGNRNSGESPVPRRKAPTPIKLAFAGAGGWIGAAVPIRIRSPKKSVPQICLLRPTFLHRRKPIAGNRNSGESPVHRR